MPMIDVTALAGTEARISSVERGSVILHCSPLAAEGEREAVRLLKPRCSIERTRSG
jgi:hypothetical protein